MARPERTQNELRLASEHVVHVIERLCGSLHDYTELQRAHHTGESPSLWTREALFDSWAVNLRHAMHFVRAAVAQPSDILACDYFPNDRWGEVLETSRGRDWAAVLDPLALEEWIHNQIVNMRYERIHSTPEAKSWPLALATIQPCAPLQAFVDNVAPELVADDFTVRAQNALDSVR